MEDLPIYSAVPAKPLQGYRSASEAISAVRVLEPSELDISNQVCTAVLFDFHWVEYVFEKSLIRIQTQGNKLQWCVSPVSSKSSSMVPDNMKLRFEHSPEPVNWLRSECAEALVGRSLSFLTLSSPGIIYVDFNGSPEYGCIMHTTLRLDSIADAVVYWSPTID